MTCKRPVAPAPAGSALPYMGLDMMAFISSYDLPNRGAVRELDLKVCLLPAPKTPPRRSPQCGQLQQPAKLLYRPMAD